MLLKKQNAESTAQPAYRRLAAVVEKMIRDRTLGDGARLPSVRQFSIQQRVSVPTALQAYASLEAQGLIEAKPRSGFYVRSIPTAPARKKLNGGRFPQVTDLAALEALDPIDVLMNDNNDATLASMGCGWPGQDVSPPPRLTQITVSMARKFGVRNAVYDYPPGAPELRHELALRSLRQGCALTADEIIVTTGATEAVALAIRATCEPGSTVIIESPSYFGTTHMLRQLQLNALPIPMDGATGLDLDTLELALKKTRASAALLCPNFHNPTGASMSEENKQRLVALLSAANIPIIEDDIYGDLPHRGPRPHCLKAYDRTGDVLLCSSFSKTLAPGYRVGYIAPGHRYRRILSLKRATSLASTSLPAFAIAEFLKTGGYDRYLRTVCRLYGERTARMLQAIEEHFPSETRVVPPGGGFVLWCELAAKTDAIRVFKKALAAGITLAPGPLFSPHGEFENFIRLNCSHPYTAKTDRAMKLLGKIVRSM